MALAFTATSDRDPLSYRAGEPMVFSFRVSDAPAGARIRWRRTGDDGREERGHLSGEAALATSLDRPGFVRIEAELLDAGGAPVARFDGGAGADVDAIRADASSQLLMPL